MDIAVGGRQAHPVLILTDIQVERCRYAASSALDASHRYTATMAALEAGASTGEAGCLTWSEVADDGSLIKVGARAEAGARVIGTTEWGANALRAARRHSTTDFVCVLRPTSYDSRRTSVTHVLREIYERAGVHQAEPRSLTAWCARRVFTETGSIEAAARTIGFRSLDRTAELIGHDWGRTP